VCACARSVLGFRRTRALTHAAPQERRAASDAKTSAAAAPRAPQPADGDAAAAAAEGVQIEYVSAPPSFDDLAADGEGGAAAAEEFSQIFRKFDLSGGGGGGEAEGDADADADADAADAHEADADAAAAAEEEDEEGEGALSKKKSKHLARMKARNRACMLACASARSALVPAPNSLIFSASDAHRSGLPHALTRTPELTLSRSVRHRLRS
jgi:hypothetical protein